MLEWIAVIAAWTASAGGGIEVELARVRQEARTTGEAIWPGYGSAPFGLLLVEAEREVLLCQPPPAGFTADGRDETTGCERHIRARSGLPGNLLAAMPLFGPPSTIVMGTPEATGVNLPRWRSTLLHEHFHQWQAALPDYYARVASLDLAEGDETGMWMLNYPFPYQRPDLAAAYAAAARALAAALDARGGAEFRDRLQHYLQRRRAFAAAAGERHWRYFEFQLWQEGVARWTEIAIGRASADAATRDEAAAWESETIGGLRSPDLAGQGRLVAYPLGASEAMLLDACGPAWRSAYPQLLALGPLVEEAARSCAAS